MIKYRVLRYFNDLQDDSYYYETGSTYPRDGLTPSQNRINELASTNNLQGIPLIEATEQQQQKTKTVKRKKG